MNPESRTRIIEVQALARVEGEGAIYARMEGDQVAELRLRIFEPPRFFEAFLRGRALTEVPDITARICGICPVAYQMSSVHALEQALGIHLDEPYAVLRRLLYCGEWIESHALHVLMLHAPDFFGLHSVLELSQQAPDLVGRGLQLKKAGNAIVQVVGGREVHPINIRVGGFYRIPSAAELATLVEPLKAARDTAAELVEWVAGFDFPQLEIDFEFVALHHPDEYPMNRGRLVSNRGLNIAVEEFLEHFEELHIEHSNALHCRRRDGGTSYHVGPLARVNLGFEQLGSETLELAARAGFAVPCLNPFKSIIARALEIFYACGEALRLLETFRPPAAPFVELPRRAGQGHGCTEAPRGILYHRYRVDDQGLVEEADIIPPTSQNQAQIEEDLKRLLPTISHLEHEPMTRRCEQAIRNYDPCISCATHFLKLELERT